MASTEQNAQYKALAWTLGVHALLFLFLWMFRYAIPTNEPLPEMGMEVNLGTSDQGSGNDQPMSVEDPAADIASAANKNVQQQNNEAKELMRSNEADAPGVNTANAKENNRNSTQQDNNKHKVKNNQEANNNKEKQNPRYVYKGSTGKGGNDAMQNNPGTNEGNDNGNGDKGVPNGTPGAVNYTGSPGNGNGGISHTISGRTILAFPPKDANFKEQGTVVVHVTVNREGLIVNKRIVSASSADLGAIALRKADKVRFNKNESAPEEQFGNITFVFKTKS